ncbi:energy-coupling factor transporter transmembrane component T family protein [Pleomorphochaeta sp. DL1XJH-081]|jgi:biotin transport system permease protein|uniref:energy-coupling factor transporter transmembrane component T family protein n=1 Tax=Pleomorphochaeta sp. DL1XJH-081 TaxID=3409690 RepID=UPI003BB74C92
MVEVNLFHYHDRNTFLHRANPISKIIAMLMISTALIRTTLLQTSVLSLFFIIIATAIRLPIGRYRRELRFFILMATIIALARWSSAEQWDQIALSVIRFATIVSMGMLFADTSSPDDIARSVGSLLERIPGVKGYRIGATLELTVSTIPLLFDASLQVSQARRARGEAYWRNPIPKIVSLGSTVFALLLERAEYLEAALTARLYNPDADRGSFGYRTVDVVILGVTFALLGFLFLVT